jgi:hypothetical protein
MSLARLAHHTLENEKKQKKSHEAKRGKKRYLMRWRNTTPRATVRRVIRRGLGGSPGIGEVILAITARMCSSLCKREKP